MTISIKTTTARGSGKIWRKENHKQNILYEKILFIHMKLKIKEKLKSIHTNKTTKKTLKAK